MSKTIRNITGSILIFVITICVTYLNVFTIYRYPENPKPKVIDSDSLFIHQLLALTGIVFSILGIVVFVRKKNSISFVKAFLLFSLLLYFIVKIVQFW